jgi:hypothetical protein
MKKSLEKIAQGFLKIHTKVLHFFNPFFALIVSEAGGTGRYI